MTPERLRNLERLLAPRHVACIGGDDAGTAVRECREAGFNGPVWGVNPRRPELGGTPCFARIEDLPEAPDAAFLAVPAMAAAGAVDALRRIGAGGVVCFTAGFGELGEAGAAREHELVRAAGEMALVGPNCSGLLNYVHRAPLWPYRHGGGAVERGSAFITQSGMLGNTVTLNQRSVPFAYVISAGNQAMLGVEDYLEVLISDPAVSAVGLYVEGLRDVPRFAAAALRALEAGVPIVVLKVGHSEIGARLTVTHTGSLSGTDELYQALFERLGIIRVDSPVIMLETLKLLTVTGAPRGRRLAAFTCSGGDATMLADGGERTGVTFPAPSAGTERSLVRQLPALATVSNPLDYTAPLWGDEERLVGVFGAMLDDPCDLALLVQDYPDPGLGASHGPYQADVRAFSSAVRAAGVPGAVCSVLPETLDGPTRASLIATGLAPLQGINDALVAIAGAAGYAERRIALTSCANPEGWALPPPPVGGGELDALDEWEAKRELAAAGVPIPDGRRVDARSAPEAAAQIGFPVALKLLSAALAHKTEAGAIRLGLRSTVEVAEAVAAITESVARNAPGIDRSTFLVERMIGEPIAELLVGIRLDEQFGQVLVLASGGILVELLRDSRALLLPTNHQAVSQALASLKLSRLLDGYRGRAAGDREAAIDVVLKLASFAHRERAQLRELDVNPLMVLTHGVVAVDVVLRMTRARERES